MKNNNIDPIKNLVNIDKLVSWHQSKGHCNIDNVNDRIAKLVEEVGELSQAINKELQVHNVRSEIGDVLNVLISICEIYNTDINKCIALTCEKLEERGLK